MATVDGGIMPVVNYPVLALSGWLAWDVFRSCPRMYGYVPVSLIAAFWILWIFAPMPVEQGRRFDFFVLPVVFLAGFCQFDRWRFLAVTTVSGVFMLKYNVCTNCWCKYVERK